MAEGRGGEPGAGIGFVKGRGRSAIRCAFAGRKRNGLLSNC